MGDSSRVGTLGAALPPPAGQEWGAASSSQAGSEAGSEGEGEGAAAASPRLPLPRSARSLSPAASRPVSPPHPWQLPPASQPASPWNAATLDPLAAALASLTEEERDAWAALQRDDREGRAAYL
jgi:hypothetical protein